jgi:hypothetical protein
MVVGQIPKYADGMVSNWGTWQAFDYNTRQFSAIDRKILWLKNGSPVCFALLNYQISKVAKILLNIAVVSCVLYLTFTATPWALVGLAIIPITIAIHLLHKKIDHLEHRIRMEGHSKDREITKIARQANQNDMARIIVENFGAWENLPFVRAHYENFLPTNVPVAIGIDTDDEGGFDIPIVALRIKKRDASINKIATIIFQQPLYASDWEELNPQFNSYHFFYPVIEAPHHVDKTPSILEFVKKILTDKHETYQLVRD